MPTLNLQKPKAKGTYIYTGQSEEESSPMETNETDSFEELPVAVEFPISRSVEIGVQTDKI